VASFERVAKSLKLVILNFVGIAQKENPECSTISAQLDTTTMATPQLMARTARFHTFRLLYDIDESTFCFHDYFVKKQFERNNIGYSTLR
jgi:hypothetical protein